MNQSVFAIQVPPPNGRVSSNKHFLLYSMVLFPFLTVLSSPQVALQLIRVRHFGNVKWFIPLTWKKTKQYHKANQLRTWTALHISFSQALVSPSTPIFFGNKFQRKHQKGSSTELASQMLRRIDISLQRQIPKVNFWMSKFPLRIGWKLFSSHVWEQRGDFSKVCNTKFLILPSYASEQAKDSLTKLDFFCNL